MAKTKFCAGVSDFSDSCQALILDQWGTLHNGKKLFDGVVDCLKELRQRKKIILIMSNSLQDMAANKDSLRKMGVGPSLYDRILTPGELLREGFEKRDHGIFKDLSENCFVFHEGEPFDFLKQDGVNVVDDVQRADFVLITGWDRLSKPVNELVPIIRKAVQKQIKFIAAMPDSRALLSPNYLMGPGLLLRKIREAGGVIHTYGKPFRPIFAEATRYLQEKDIFPAQTIMVGDTMAHDIVGAANNGMESCLVKSGMHGGAFRNCASPAETDRALNVLISQYNTMPTYLVDSMKWGKALPDRKHRRRRQPGEGRPLRRIRRRRVPGESDD